MSRVSTKDIVKLVTLNCVPNTIKSMLTYQFSAVSISTPAIKSSDLRIYHILKVMFNNDNDKW